VKIEQAEDQEAEKERQQNERLEFIKSTIETMGKALSIGELKKIHDSAVRKLTLRNDKKGADRIAIELEKQRTRIAGTVQEKAS